MSQAAQALTVIGLVMTVVVALLVWLARDAARARAAADDARQLGPRPGEPAVAGKGLPLLEVALLRLPVATADALRGRLAASPDPALVGAVAVPIAALEPVLGLLEQALERAGCRVPFVSWDGHVRALVEAASVAGAADALDRALGQQRAELVQALVELDPGRPPEAAVAAALPAGGVPPRGTPPGPALDAARLVAPLRDRCREAAARGESVLALTRLALHREVVRVTEGMDPLEPPARVFCLELQVARGPGHADADPHELLLTPTRSAALPSRRQTLLLLFAGLAGADLAVPLSELGTTGMVFCVGPDDVATLVRALEAAQGERRPAFVGALLDTERDDQQVRPGATSSPAHVEEALATGELRGDLALAVEAAAVVPPLLAVARDARQTGQSLILCYRTCDLVRGG